jgi:hypothetical protein
VTLLELLRTHVHEFVQKAVRLDISITHTQRGNDITKDHIHRQMLVNQLDELSKMCAASELPVTKISTDHVLGSLKGIHDTSITNVVHQQIMNTMNEGLLVKYLDDIQDRLIDELSTKLFIQIPYSRKGFFECPREKWEPVIERFSETISDIEECSKCFALSRYAASVFHAVQIVEFGLLQLGTFIGVTDPHSGWTAVSGKLEKIVIRTEYKDRSGFEKKHFSFLEQMHGVILAMKNAWRNKISHAEGRLVLMSADFSPDVAEEIMIAVRSFMRRLATDMPR